MLLVSFWESFRQSADLYVQLCRHVNKETGLQWHAFNLLKKNTESRLLFVVFLFSVFIPSSLKEKCVKAVEAFARTSSDLKAILATLEIHYVS